MRVIICTRGPAANRGWRALVCVELANGPSWEPIPADGPGVSYTNALDIAITHIRGGRRARLMSPDGMMGEEIPKAYAAECSASAGPLFDRNPNTEAH